MLQSELKEICDYDSFTGTLVWKQAGKKRIVGNPIGSKGSHGYLETCINRKRYLVHRLIWLWHYGTFPAEHTDHINHDRLDNRISNLREATNQQNNFNQSKQKRQTTSKYRGVSWDTRKSKWKSSITAGNIRHKFIGYFKSEKEAALAYNIKAIELYGEFAYLNQI